jgi:hypothetical protein
VPEKTPDIFATDDENAAGGFTGVLPPAARGPLVVAQAHGILTGKSSPSWPDFGTAYFSSRHPEVVPVNTEYFELPLPRLAAVRNPSRSRHLVRRMLTLAQYGVEMRPQPAELAFVSHSNGAVLALQACRALIAQGIAVRAMVLIAPAIKTRASSREIAGWLESGMLGSALLVRPMRDAVIGLVGRSWRTKLVAWPWGSLGDDGWAVDEFPEFTELNIRTIDLPDMGHSDPVAARNRRWLYETIIAPALGLSTKEGEA